METNLITISGPPASGTTTVAEKLSEELNFAHISGGDIFRKMASERGLTLSELTELSDSDPSIDKEVDMRLKQIIAEYDDGSYTVEEDGLIVESRLAGWHGRDYADLLIYISASKETRLGRIGSRDETEEEFLAREASEIDRYKEYYGIDTTQTHIYDLCIDSGSNTPDQIVSKILNNM